MIDLEPLKEIALKATPGPWWIDSHGHAMVEQNTFEIIFHNDNTQRPAVRHEDTGNLSHWRNDNDASYIAAANPSVMLELIIELETLRAEREQALKQEPVKWAWQNEHGAIFNMYNSENEAHEDMFGFAEGKPVAFYTKPFPLQPSPAVAVPTMDKCLSDFEIFAAGNGHDISRDSKNIGYLRIETARLFCTYSEGWASGFSSALLSTPTPPSAEQLSPMEKDKHHNWDYYQELLKQNGFSGITDLLSKYHALERSVEQPDNAALNNEPDFYATELMMMIVDASQMKEFPNMAVAYPIPLWKRPPVKPQRITEQELRKLIGSVSNWIEGFDFKLWMNVKGAAILEKLNEQREPDYKAPNGIPNEWRVTRFGQIKVGDVLSLVCGDSHICTTAKEILNAGTNREEVIYNRKKNHYFITSMVLDGTSTHKHVFIVPSPAIAQCEGQGNANEQ